MKNFVFYNKLFEKIFFNRSVKRPLIDHLCLVQIIFAKTKQSPSMPFNTGTIT